MQAEDMAIGEYMPNCGKMELSLTIKPYKD